MPIARPEDDRRSGRVNRRAGNKHATAPIGDCDAANPFVAIRNENKTIAESEPVSVADCGAEVLEGNGSTSEESRIEKLHGDPGSVIGVIAGVDPSLSIGRQSKELRCTRSCRDL